MSKRISVNKISPIALAITLVVIILFVAYSYYISRQFAEEEHKRIEIWAGATKAFIQADENTDIDFVTSIIEDNTTIPVYMLDSNGNIVDTRNVVQPVDDPTQLHGPIEVRLSENDVQYIYYDESIYLHSMHYFPYIQVALIILFIAVALITLLVAKRSEQNRIWAGMSKEAAHQLGTPISSLNAWKELLQTRYPEDELLPQMEVDINRLQVVADRFSKVGSMPVLEEQLVAPIIERTIAYMKARTSHKVEFSFQPEVEVALVKSKICAPLLEWVLENLLKNATDAMNGKGQISISIQKENSQILLDIADTGHGMERSQFSAIFTPGYTTKQRGWGLGLSLSKRIVEDYHGGKIFVKQSQLGKGTVFRIVLKESKNSGATA